MTFAALKSRFGSAKNLPGYIWALCSLTAFLLMLAVTFEQKIVQNALPLVAPLHQNPSEQSALHYLDYIFNVQFVAFLFAFAFIAFLDAQKKITPLLRHALLFLIAAGAVFAAATFNFGSTDLLNYIAYGYKLVVLHLSPYTPLSDALPDPLIAATSPVWINVPSVYGPTAVALFSFLNMLVPSSLSLLVPVFKATWLALFGLCALLTHKLLRADGVMAYARWFGLFANPVLWSLCLRDAHVELIMLVLTAACLLAMRSREWFWSGVLFGMLCGTKSVALMWLPFFLLRAFHDGDEQTRWRNVKKLAAGFALYMAPLYSLTLGADWALVVKSAVSYQHSPQLVPWEINNILGLPLFQLSQDMIHDGSRWIAELVFLAGYGWFLHRAYKKPGADFAAMLGLVMAWGVLNMSYSNQWYLLWPLLPLLLGARTRTAAVSVVALFTLCGINLDSAANVSILLAAIVPAAVLHWLKTLAQSAERQPGRVNGRLTE